MNVPRQSGNEETSQQSKPENPISKTLVSDLNPDRYPISNLAGSSSSPSCQDLFLPNTHNIRTSIPKHITTLDENRVLRYLELLRNCALRASASNFASKVHIFSDDFTDLSKTKFFKGSHDMAKLDIDQCPSVDFESNFNAGRRNLPQPVYPDLGHKRVLSLSSTITSCSDKSSSSSNANSFRAILQCTWKDGLPQYVFSVDDKTEVYYADLSEGESSGDKVPDHVYKFCTRKNDRDRLQSVVGMMRVSSSITSRSDSLFEVRETRYVLSICDLPSDEMQMSNRNRKMSKRLTNKMLKVFGSGHSCKQRISPKFSESSAIFEDSAESSKDSYVPNLELAAIVVREICKSRKEDDLGGWGLKFLKKSGMNATIKTNLPSEPTRNNGECSTSLDILIPAGVHGGPKMRVGGPSSLTERWVSGGRCDCGGWDMGCPLTILNTGSCGPNSSVSRDDWGECKSCDLFLQGSKQDFPILKMTNVHEDLYYIHFESTLSTLQAFAIATAIIHSRSSVLRSRV